MAVDVATLRAHLEADTSRLEKDLSSAEGRMEKFSQKASSLGKAMSLGVTAPLTALGVAAVNAASDMGESLSKVQVVFGETAVEIEKFASGAAKNLGISKQEALDASGAFGGLLSTLGVAPQAFSEMSTKLIGTAADLASFNNADPSQVLEAMRAGLIGETEPLRRFGVNLSAARIEAEALASGLAKPVKSFAQIDLATKAYEEAQAEANAAIKEFGEDAIEAQPAILAMEKAHKKLEKALAGAKPEISDAAKAQAAFNLIMKDSSLAQGDFARTSDGAANKQRILAANVKDLSAKLGQKLLPIQQKLLETGLGLVNFLTSLSDPAQTAVLALAGIAAAAGPMLVAAAKMVQAFKIVGGAIRGMTALAAANPWLLFAAATVAIAIVVIKNWDTIKQHLLDVWNTLKSGASQVFGFLKNLFLTFTPLGVIVSQWSGIKALFLSVWSVLKDGARAAIDFVIGKFNALASKVRGAIDAVKRTIGKLPFVPGSPIPLIVDTNKAVDGVLSAFKRLQTDLPAFTGGQQKVVGTNNFNLTVNSMQSSGGVQQDFAMMRARAR